MTNNLPIEDCLPTLIDALSKVGQAVLQAPPGAGKTTRVPLAMLEAGLTSQKILMLEPRRLATRAAADRLAAQLGQCSGQTVGYRMRGDSQVSKATRIEVVTEGILTRMIQSDPELPGIGAVIFDEFHERSLNADLGLALCLELRAALRPDLILLAMSATLDAGPVATLMGGAPVITSAGRSFAVADRWLPRPLPPKTRFEAAMADLISTAIAETNGGVLAFLPGEGEIKRTEALLKDRLPADCRLRPLYGALPFAAQRSAIAPEADGRKLVLATSIAETSLTIEDIRVVVDGGKSRRARFDPGSGMSRLVTERVSRAEATQRAGRAGRVAPGICYKLWARGENGALPAYPPAEIETADLTGLALELALWGTDALPFLTPPPEAALAEARALLTRLRALDAKHRITAHGRRLAAMPLHPRLAHMLHHAGKPAAPLAAILSERDFLTASGSDLALRLKALRDPKSVPAQIHQPTRQRALADAKRLSKLAPDTAALSHAQMAALAYPDRIALRRPGGQCKYLLSGGKGAVLDASDPLNGTRLLVVTNTDGTPRDARIRQAIALPEGELRALFGADISWQDNCHWSRRDSRVMARRQEKLGALVLEERAWKDAPPEVLAAAMMDGIRDLGLPSNAAIKRFQARADLMRQSDPSFPDLSEDALLKRSDGWLMPFLSGITTAKQWRDFDLLPALKSCLSWEQQQTLDERAPAHFTTPLGRRIPIDYSLEHPEISLRLQEMFGQTSHPSTAGQPLRVTLLSPAGRPLQTTMDLPGFWKSSYSDVRKDMRGRYPKHPWPEDPTEADPTLRAKQRKYR